MTNAEGFELKLVRAEAFPARLLLLRTVCDESFHQLFSSEEGVPETEGDDSLDGAAEDERDYVRRRLRDELGREPSEEEVDDWLRRHTEGY